jgi:dCMP deaminase
MLNRLSWPQYAMKIALAASWRSEDPYVKVGACVLRHDNSVASVGYNGAVSGVDIDWSDRDARREKVIHAETNCLRYLLPNEGRLIAVTLKPCNDCLKNIASYGIKNVFYLEDYSKCGSTDQTAKEYGIALEQISLDI